MHQLPSDIKMIMHWPRERREKFIKDMKLPHTVDKDGRLVPYWPAVLELIERSQR
jgi:hypothetical protein